VDPDAGVEEHVVAQLLEEGRAVGQAVQVLGEGQELLQDRPGDVHPGRLDTRQRTDRR